jgi:hypothetical protein
MELHDKFLIEKLKMIIAGEVTEVLYWNAD